MGKDCIAQVTHSLGGGTEKFVREISSEVSKRGVPVATIRPVHDASNGVAARCVLRGPSGAVLESRSLGTLDVDGFSALWADWGVAVVHVHNLVGYPLDFARTIAVSSENLRCRLVITIHDYQSFCPRINLVDSSMAYCGEPAEDVCQSCVNFAPSSLQISIPEWRAAHHHLLHAADAIAAPSVDAAARVMRHYRDLAVAAVPHGEIEWRGQRSESASRLDLQGEGCTNPRRLRVGILGVLAAHKGAQVVSKVAQRALERSLPVDFLVIGHLQSPLGNALPGNVSVTGAYEERLLPLMLSEADLDVLFYPAIWPETFSYTLSEGLRTATPIVAPAIGSFCERLRGEPNAVLVDMGEMNDPDLVLESLVNIAGSCRVPKRSDSQMAWDNCVGFYYPHLNAGPRSGSATSPLIAGAAMLGTE